MATLAELVEDAGRHDNLDLELATLGTEQADEIAEILSSFLSARLAPVGAAIFYRHGTGVVAGVRLGDGREVVLKLHRWRASVTRLAAAQSVQRHLNEAGMPAPKPLLSPEPLGVAAVTVEELLRSGSADGHDPVVRRAMARNLAAFIEAASPLRSLADLDWAAILSGVDGPLWRDPHDLRFDFAASASGAEWIDELARLGSSRLAALDLDVVVGHMDWCAGNLGFSGPDCNAIYDWDSVALAPEPVVVGAAAAQFSADWAAGADLPSLSEMSAFVADYEDATGRQFDGVERAALNAANLVHCAYGARCQHSDARLAPGPTAARNGGWIGLLRQRAVHALGS